MSRYGLPASRRLKRKSDFTAFFEKKNPSVFDKTYRLIYRTNDASRKRLGVVVSRKTANAVRRNKEKRWVREIYRKAADEIQNGMDYVVVVRKCHSMSFEKREQRLLSLFRKVDKSK